MGAGLGLYSDVKGIGKIRITNPDGSVVILTDVRYMPDMSRNLISYGMLEKSGCSYRGEDYTVIFYKDGQKVISGKYNQGLYYQRMMQVNWSSVKVAFSANLTSKAFQEQSILPKEFWSTFTQTSGVLHLHRVQGMEGDC
uniref:Retrovirus-related Pol polyprotein from transposon TNT 1-94-like beta-barrel domain-containing protein n=1 Tax=Noccaea caerulescens TaxID=107243 RepID=A0A1J3I206_NOCCA